MAGNPGTRRPSVVRVPLYRRGEDGGQRLPDEVLDEVLGYTPTLARENRGQL